MMHQKHNDSNIKQNQNSPIVEKHFFYENNSKYISIKKFSEQLFEFNE